MAALSCSIHYIGLRVSVFSALLLFQHVLNIYQLVSLLAIVCLHSIHVAYYLCVCCTDIFRHFMVGSELQTAHNIFKTTDMSTADTSSSLKVFTLGLRVQVALGYRNDNGTGLEICTNFVLWLLLTTVLLVGRTASKYITPI